MEKLYRLKQVREITGLGKSTIYELMGRSEFPRPYQLGRQAVAWKSSEIQGWMDSLPRSAGWGGE